MTRPAAFVIMPFSKDFLRVYERIICPALDDYDVLRADSRVDIRGILEKIVTGIREADLVIADVSGTNANVMYELGIAHSLGKPTVMIAQSVDEVPFDLRAYPVHEYSIGGAQASKFEAHLRGIARKHRNGELLFANPVSDFSPPSGEGVSTTASASAYSYAECISDLAVVSIGINSVVESYSEAVERFYMAVDDALRRYRVAARRRAALADRLRDFAVALHILVSSLHEDWACYGRAVTWLVAPERAIPFGARENFVGLVSETDEALNAVIASIATHRARAKALAKYGNGNLGHAVEEAYGALTGVLNEIMLGKMHIARALRVFASRSTGPA